MTAPPSPSPFATPTSDVRLFGGCSAWRWMGKRLGKASDRRMGLLCLILLGFVVWPWTLEAQTDITAQVEAGQNVVLTGGNYVVRIPLLGAGGTIPAIAANLYAKYDLTCYSCGHYVGTNTSSLVYRGVISGTGVLLVTNATSTVNPTHVAGGAQTPFTGGMLLFTNPQTFTSGTATPTLLIDGNTVVAFDKGTGTDVGGSFNPDTTNPRNITNNGYLYSYNNNPLGQQDSWGSIMNTETDAGVVTFENGNVLTNGSQYTGVVYDMNGSYLQPQGSYPDPAAPIVQSNIFTFETQGPNYLMQGTTATYKSVYDGDYYSFGADTLITGKGIQVFNGLALPATGSTKKDLVAASQARLLDYIGSLTGGFGQVFSIQATMQMGSGQPIVDNGDGTNNTFLQTNIEGTGSGLNIGGFEPVPVSFSQALQNQAIAFDYSGTYSYDAGIDLQYTSQGVSAVKSNYGNLVVMNPDPTNTGKAPNHLILTVPMFMDGITEIDQNAVLQLGDGTAGNRTSKTVTVNGQSYTGTYSSSYGNGMILTHENTLLARAQNPGAFFSVPLVDQIIDNGKLIVDNVADASDITLADATIASIMQTNELDTITGTGGLTQMGTLALTLEENTAYTGPTEIVDGTLFLATSTAGVAPDISKSSGVNLSGAGAIFDISKGGNQTIQDLSGVSGSTINLGTNTLTAGTGNTTSFLGTITGTGGFKKQSGGTLVLGGANTYTGNTLVAGGTLQLGAIGVGGAALAGPTTVGGGSALSVEGADTISGPLTNQGSLQMNAGSALQLTGSYTGNAASTILMEVTSVTAPQLASQGTVTLGGTLSVQLDPGGYGSQTYVLIQGSAVTGTFSNVVCTGVSIMPATAAVTYTATSVVLTITAPVQTPLLTLSANPTTAPQGTNVTLHVTAGGPGANSPVPTGVVTLLDGGVVIGTLTLDGTGNAILNISTLAVGTHTITAIYPGDKNYNAATSASVTVTITAPVTTPLLTLSATPTTAPVGTNVVLHVTVAGTGTNPPVPTGTVTLKDGGVVLGTLTLDGTGNAILNIATLTVGTHTITASYTGDKNYSAALSGGVIVTITAPVTAPSLTLSANPTTAPLGTNVALHVTAAGSGTNAPVPTGTVTLMDGGAAIGAVTLDGTGNAVLNVATLAVGTHTITASYGGDKNYSSAVSGSVTVTITAAGVTTPLVTLGAYPTTAAQGTSVSLQVTVSATGTNGPVPTGTVTLMDGGVVIGTVTLDGTGSATFNTTALGVGMQTITAVYGGDKNYSATTSGSVTVTINATGTGAGGPGDFTLSSGTSTITMKFGAAQTAQLQVVSVNGFNQAVGLSCPGLPASLQCSFAPATVTAQGTPVGSALTITSTPAVPYQVGQMQGRVEEATRAGLGGVGFVLSVPVLLLLSMQRRRAALRKLLMVLLFVSCAGAFELLTGCGCGIQATSVTTVVTVQGASGNLQHAVTVTVTTTQ